MGSVYEKNGKWYLRWKLATGQWTDKPSTAQTKRAALGMVRELETQVERQLLGLESRPVDLKSTLGDLCLWWLEERCPPDGKEIEEQRLRKHIIDAPLGALPLIAVQSEVVNEHFVAMERGGSAPASVNRLRAILHSVFEQASGSHPKRWIGPNPIAKVEVREVPVRIYETLRADQVPALLPHVHKDWRDVFAAALFLALRKGELCGLRKVDVHLADREIDICRSYDKDTTKGGHGDVLPIAEPLVPFLEHALATFPGELLFPWPDGSMRTKECDPHKVLRTAMKRAGFVAGWDHVCRRCAAAGTPHVERHQDRELRRCPTCEMKLWPRALEPTIRFHDLRHTTATLLLRAGVDAHRVQRILRHADIKTTTDTYGHLVVEDLRAGVATLPAVPNLPAVTESLAANLLMEPAEQKSEGPAPVATTEDPGLISDGRCRVRTCDPCRVKADPGGCWTSPRLPKAAQPFANGSLAVSRSSPDLTPEVEGFAANLLTRFEAVEQGAVPVPAPSLTVAQVARHLQVSTALVYRLCERGEIGHVRVSNAIRIPVDQLRAYLARASRRGGA